VEHARAYTWPGNIRELENLVERAVIMSRSAQLDAVDLFASTSATPSENTLASTSDATLEAVERAHIQQVLERTGWVIEGERGAARILGLNPSTLRGRLRKLGIHKNS